jgi:ubiquinone biosynthesis protein
MNEQVGWRGMLERFKAEAPRYSQLLPQLPRLAHQALTQAVEPQQDNTYLMKQLLEEQRRTNRILGFAIYFGGGLIGGMLLVQLFVRWYYFAS